MRRGIIVFLVFLSLALALALAGMVWRHVRREALYRRAEVTAALRGRTQELAAVFRELLDEERETLAMVLREAGAGDIDELPSRHGAIRAVFVTDTAGTPLHPGPGDVFWRRLVGLFPEPDSDAGDVAETSDLPEAAAEPEPEAAAEVEMEAEDVVGRTELPTAMTGGGEARPSRFTRELGPAGHAWVPWFVGDNLLVLLWVRDDAHELVFGMEVAAAELLTALASRIVLGDEDEHLGFEVVGIDGRVLAVVGGGERIPDAWGESALVEEMAPQMLPGVRVRGAVDPACGELPQAAVMAQRMQAGVLLAVFVGFMGLLFWLGWRELAAATQKAGFASEVARELGNGIARLRGGAWALSHPAPGARSDERDRHVRMMLVESELLSYRLASAMTLELMEAGRRNYHPAPVAVDEVADELVEVWRLILADHGMVLRAEDYDGRRCAMVDRESLVQVLRILLDNAAVHAAVGGEATLAITASPEDELHLRVLDRGPGVPAERREAIFQEAAGGDGFGLVIARAMLRDQGGDLSCHARPGGGAEFRVILPAAATASDS